MLPEARYEGVVSSVRRLGRCCACVAHFDHVRKPMTEALS